MKAKEYQSGNCFGLEIAPDVVAKKLKQAARLLQVLFVNERPIQ